MKLLVLVLTLFASPARSQGEVKHVKHLREPRVPTPGPSPANQALPGVPVPKLVSEGKKAKPSAVGVPKKEIQETEAAQIAESAAAVQAEDVFETIDTMPHIRSAEEDVGEVERSAHRPGGVHGGGCRGLNCNHGKETEAAQIGESVAATTAADVFHTIATIPHIRSAEEDVGEVERSAHRPGGVHGGGCRPGVNCNHGKETEAAQIGESVAATTAEDVLGTIDTMPKDTGAAQAAEAAEAADAAEAAEATEATQR